MKKSYQQSNRHYFFFLGLTLMLAFAAMRGYGMLGPLLARPLLPLSFTLMMLVPFLFLNRVDRFNIGLRKCNSYTPYLMAFVIGSAAAFLCYRIGIILFQNTNDNWYVTVHNFYMNNPAYNKLTPVWQLFLVFTVPALIFSPVGEEIFFRGFFQETLKLNFNDRVSALIECSCFGLVHVFHHGLTYTNERFVFYPTSALIWILLMTGVAYIFLQVKQKTGSLYPVIVCHASFNLIMNVIIFYYMQ